MYKSTLHEFIRKITKEELHTIAIKAGVKPHYIRRLAHGVIPNPQYQQLINVLSTVNQYSLEYPDRNLPIVDISDIIK